MKSVEIDGHTIGPGNPPFVIAEAGINHEGEYSKALQLVDAAVSAGADCVKFQCHITEKEMVETSAGPSDRGEESIWNIVKRCELTESEERSLKEYCEGKGIVFLSTPFSREAADRLEGMGVSAYKIGSGECNNLPLLEHIARFGKPIILSTGMNDLSSISRSVETVKKADVPLILLHCTSMYPTPYEYVQLGVIDEMAREFGVPIGLSDHSLGIYTCLGAVALGACVLEKHITVDKSWPGPDISISIEPTELQDLVVGSRAVFDAKGGKKQIFKEEEVVISFAYASVVSIKEINAGDEFTDENIWVKRPGTGSLRAADLPKILGRRAARDIDRDEQLSADDVAGY